MPATFSVPPLKPNSCAAPPCIIGVSTDVSLTYRAPTPFGALTLWDEMDRKSQPISFTFISWKPTACTQSVWKRMFLLRQSSPISWTGLTAPVSLLTYITETRPVCSVSASNKSPTETSPLGFTPKNVAPKSDFITFLVLQHNGLQTLLTALRTESCSTAEVMMWVLPFASKYGRSPENTRLFASLPPEVKIT